MDIMATTTAVRSVRQGERERERDRDCPPGTSSQRFFVQLVLVTASEGAERHVNCVCPHPLSPKMHAVSNRL